MPTDIASISGFADPALARPFDPERNPTKAAAFWLRRDIVRGVFSPMERLKVEPLVQFYGIGHSPVREAIILLSSSGLVIHEHLKGYRVAPVSLEDYDDVRGVYQRLYKLAVDMAMEHGDEHWEEQVVVQLHRLTKVRPGNGGEGRERWQHAYGQLHASLLSGCNSPLMMQLFADIGARLERYVHLFSEMDSSAPDYHVEHRAIVEAVLARNRSTATALIDNYFALGQPMRDAIVGRLRAEAPKRRRGRPPLNLAAAG